MSSIIKFLLFENVANTISYHIVSIIDNLSTFSPLLAIIVGFKKKTSLLWIYALTGFVFDIVMQLISYANKNTDTSICVNIFFICEFMLVAFYYRDKIFEKRKPFYVFILAITSIYVSIAISKSIYVLNDYGEALFEFTYILFGILGFYTILRDQKIIYLGQSGFFWFNVAILIYSTGNFLVFLSYQYVSQTNANFNTNIWLFHNILNISFSILVAISLSRKKTG